MVAAQGAVGTQSEHVRRPTDTSASDRSWSRVGGAGRRALVALFSVVVLASAGTVIALALRGSGRSVAVTSALVDVKTGQVDTTLYVPSSATARSPAPAVVVSPGFGQSKDTVRADARALADAGYVALAWSLPGFGRSPGPIALDSPDREVADLSGLLDRLAARPDVLSDGPGDPRVALVGGSYGGGVSLLGAAYDRRVDATVPVITWNSLVSSFLPDAAGGAGVFKAQYAAVFFASSGPVGARFAPELAAAYARLAQSGTATPADRALLERSSASSVLDRISAPTLLLQGQDDTLFPLAESLTTARGLAAHGTPVSLAWLTGGHDKPFGKNGEAHIRALTRTWLDRWLRRDQSVSTGPQFRWDRSTGGSASARTLPPLTAARPQPLEGADLQLVLNPPGGRPAAITSVPGAGALSSALSGIGRELTVPGQTASWSTPRLARSSEVVGASTLSVRVRSSTGSAVLFAALRDAAPDGSSVLPGGLVAPLRLSGLPADGRTVTLTLPAVAHVFPAGHRLQVTLSSTDLAYAGPPAPAAYSLSLDRATALAVPITPVRSSGGYRALALTVGSLALAALALLAAVLVRRRLRRRAVDLGDDDAPPVEVRGLVKSYADGFRAVDGVDMVIRRGQVLGLLGPNGAGKTTTLRMLAGLIAPTAGEVRLFGRRVDSGAPVLSRVGLLIEGPGLLPHLSGRDNLRLYWTSTAPSMQGSYVEEALEVAGLGDAVDRPVRTYSQGMRQRLAIAQAMLGRPDLLVLDEPTNGLDPPQIREVREVLQRIAGTGRTVLVSSHLLAEVEQTCTHAVVMSRGKVVASGEVADLLDGDTSVRVDVADGARDRAAEVARALPGVVDVTASDGALLVDLAGASRAELVRALVRADVPVDGIGTRRRLEDVFLELTGTGAPS